MSIQWYRHQPCAQLSAQPLTWCAWQPCL